MTTSEAGRITRYVDYWNPLVAVEALTPGEDAASRSLGRAPSAVAERWMIVLVTEGR